MLVPWILKVTYSLFGNTREILPRNSVRSQISVQPQVSNKSESRVMSSGKGVEYKISRTSQSLRRVSKYQSHRCRYLGF